MISPDEHAKQAKPGKNRNPFPALDRLQHFLKNKMQATNGGSYLVQLGINSQNWDIIHKGWQIVKGNQEQINRCITCLIMQSMSVDELEPCSLREIISQTQTTLESQLFDSHQRCDLDISLPEIWVPSNFDLLKLVIVKLIGIFLSQWESDQTLKIRIEAQQIQQSTSISLTAVGAAVEFESFHVDSENATEIIDSLDWQTVCQAIELLRGTISNKILKNPIQTQIVLTFSNSM